MKSLLLGLTEWLRPSLTSAVEHKSRGNRSTNVSSKDSSRIDNVVAARGSQNDDCAASGVGLSAPLQMKNQVPGAQHQQHQQAWCTSCVHSTTPPGPLQLSSAQGPVTNGTSSDSSSPSCSSSSSSGSSRGSSAAQAATAAPDSCAAPPAPLHSTSASHAQNDGGCVSMGALSSAITSSADISCEHNLPATTTSPMNSCSTSSISASPSSSPCPLFDLPGPAAVRLLQLLVHKDVAALRSVCRRGRDMCDSLVEGILVADDACVPDLVASGYLRRLPCLKTIVYHAGPRNSAHLPALLSGCRAAGVQLRHFLLETVLTHRNLLSPMSPAPYIQPSPNHHPSTSQAGTQAGELEAPALLTLPVAAPPLFPPAPAPAVLPVPREEEAAGAVPSAPVPATAPRFEAAASGSSGSSGSGSSGSGSSSGGPHGMQQVVVRPQNIAAAPAGPSDLIDSELEAADAAVTAESGLLSSGGAFFTGAHAFEDLIGTSSGTASSTGAGTSGSSSVRSMLLPLHEPPQQIHSELCATGGSAGTGNGAQTRSAAASTDASRAPAALAAPNSSSTTEAHASLPSTSAASSSRAPVLPVPVTRSAPVAAFQRAGAPSAAAAALPTPSLPLATTLQPPPPDAPLHQLLLHPSGHGAPQLGGAPAAPEVEVHVGDGEEDGGEGEEVWADEVHVSAEALKTLATAYPWHCLTFPMYTRGSHLRGVQDVGVATKLCDELAASLPASLRLLHITTACHLKDYAAIARLTRLTYLQVDNCSWLSSEALASLSSLTALDTLSLVLSAQVPRPEDPADPTLIDASVLGQLSRLTRLTELELSLHFAEPAGLSQLSQLAHLQYLFLGSHVEVAGEGVWRALGSLPRLMFLQVDGHLELSTPLLPPPDSSSGDTTNAALTSRVGSSNAAPQPVPPLAPAARPPPAGTQPAFPSITPRPSPASASPLSSASTPLSPTPSTTPSSSPAAAAVAAAAADCPFPALQAFWVGGGLRGVSAQTVASLGPALSHVQSFASGQLYSVQLDQACQLLRHMTRLAKLQLLDVSRLRTAEQVQDLMSSLAPSAPTLTSLTLHYSSGLDDTGVEALARPLSSLKELRIRGCARVTQGGLRQLVRMSGAAGPLPALRSIVMEGCGGRLGVEEVAEMLRDEGREGCVRAVAPSAL